MSVIIFIVILLVLVLVHEFGHFFAAKKFGIRVDEFGFGFPPKLFGKKYGETEYTFNLLPLGGFVKIFGETPDEESTSGSDAERSFINKAKWKQAVVLVAGVVMNFLLAWLLFSIGFMSGMPTSASNAPEGYIVENTSLVITSVEKDSPAEKAGLQPGDKIISIQNEALPGEVDKESVSNPSPEELKYFVTSYPNRELEINYERDNSISTLTVIPVAREAGEQAAIGISMDQIGTTKLPFFGALWQGMKYTLIVTKDTAVGLVMLLVDAVRGQGNLAAVTGPVGMVGIVGDAYEFGFAYLLSFAALISINLAVINLFPFPALDGGRLFFLLIEKIKGSRINPKVANAANLAGFVLLITLMLVVTYRDIVKLF